MLFDGASTCRVESCVIDRVGGNAIFFGNYNRNCAVRSCRISDVGANGVAVVGDPTVARSPDRRAALLDLCGASRTY